MFETIEWPIETIIHHDMNTETSSDQLKRHERLQRLKKILRGRAKLKKLTVCAKKTSNDRSLERSMLSKSQSSFELSLLQRTVLMMNNRALAKALEESKMTNRDLNEIIATLKSENIELRLQFGEFSQFQKQKMSKELEKLKVQFMQCSNAIEELRHNCQLDLTPCADSFAGVPASNCVYGSNKTLARKTCTATAPEDYNYFTGKRNSLKMTPIEEASFRENNANISGDDTRENPDLTINFEASPLKSNRLTYDIPQSRQISDLPTPVKCLRGKLRRSTHLPPEFLGSNIARPLQDEGTILSPVDMEFTTMLMPPIQLNVGTNNVSGSLKNEECLPPPGHADVSLVSEPCPILQQARPQEDSNTLKIASPCDTVMVNLLNREKPALLDELSHGTNDKMALTKDCSRQVEEFDRSCKVGPKCFPDVFHKRTTGNDVSFALTKHRAAKIIKLSDATDTMNHMPNKEDVPNALPSLSTSSYIHKCSCSSNERRCDCVNALQFQKRMTLSSVGIDSNENVPPLDNVSRLQRTFGRQSLENTFVDHIDAFSILNRMSEQRDSPSRRVLRHRTPVVYKEPSIMRKMRRT